MAVNEYEYRFRIHSSAGEVFPIFVIGTLKAVDGFTTEVNCRIGFPFWGYVPLLFPIGFFLFTSTSIKELFSVIPLALTFLIGIAWASSLVGIMNMNSTLKRHLK